MKGPFQDSSSGCKQRLHFRFTLGPISSSRFVLDNSYCDNAVRIVITSMLWSNSSQPTSHVDQVCAPSCAVACVQERGKLTCMDHDLPWAAVLRWMFIIRPNTLGGIPWNIRLRREMETLPKGPPR